MAPNLESDSSEIGEKNIAGNSCSVVVKDPEKSTAGCTGARINQLEFISSTDSSAASSTTDQIFDQGLCDRLPQASPSSESRFDQNFEIRSRTAESDSISSFGVSGRDGDVGQNDDVIDM